MRCPVKEGWCAHTTQCGDCPFFAGTIGRVVWLCSSCIHDNSSLSFYHKGACDQCGKDRLVLMPVLISELNRDSPEEEEPREEDA